MQEWVSLVNTGALPGIMLYLFYRDFVRPRRNSRKGNPGPNGNYAREEDVASLATSFREHRARMDEQVGGIRERLVRVETLLEDRSSRP